MTFSAARFFTKSINTYQYQCADPTKPVGTPACCTRGENDLAATRRRRRNTNLQELQISPDEKKGWCLWAQEHTTKSEAEPISPLDTQKKSGGTRATIGEGR